MKFSKKTNYALIGFLILLNIIIRYPLVPHEIGADSFQIHSYANSITSFGYATWIIHPYSFLGLTPDSYPSAIPFLLSGMSQSMNINMEFSILLLAIIIGLLGLFGAILLAKQIKNDDLFIFIVAFLFSTSPIFLRFTIWTTATRHIFMALFPFFLWTLLKLRDFSEIKWKYLFFSILIFIMLISSHRMGLLLFIIIFAFITTILIFRYLGKIQYNITLRRMSFFIWFIIFLFFILLQVLSVGFYNEINITHDYQSGNFLKGNAPEIILSNMIIDYGSRIGILSVFGIIGFGILFFKRTKSNIEDRKNFIEVFTLIILLYSSSFFMLGLYLSLFLLLILVIITGMGIIWSLKLLFKIKWNIITKNSTFFSIIFITILLIGSLFFSYLMIQHWFKSSSPTNDQPWIEDETIDIAFYLNTYEYNYTTLSNSGSELVRLYAWRTEPQDYRIDLERTSIEKGNVIDLITKDTLYIKQEDVGQPEIHLPTLNCNDNNVINYLSINNVKFIIERKPIEGKSGSILGVKDNRFIQSLPRERYKVYENDLETMWVV
jgi:hypothetical protein